MTYFIVAVDEKWGIAKDHKIPWHYKEDFAFFKERTQNVTCCMGYNTFAEIAQMRKYPEKNSHLLPGRRNFVITKKTDLIVNSDVNISNDIESIAFLSSPVAYIGGIGIYDYAMGSGLASCSFGYITRIKHDHGCNLHFDEQKLVDNFKMTEILGETDDLRFERWERKDLNAWNKMCNEYINEKYER